MRQLKGLKMALDSLAEEEAPQKKEDDIPY